MNKVIKILSKTIICLIGDEMIGQIIWYLILKFCINQTEKKIKNLIKNLRVFLLFYSLIIIFNSVIT